MKFHINNLVNMREQEFIFEFSHFHQQNALELILSAILKNAILFNIFRRQYPDIIFIMYLRNIIKFGFTNFQKYELPKLDYAYDALQPVISKQQLEIHHLKHHKAYVDNLNAHIEKIPNAINDPKQHNSDTPSLFTVVKNTQFNLGGHVNHSIYWKNLAPANKEGGKYPSEGSEFGQQVKKQYGSFEKLSEAMVKKAMDIKGSGWAWLAFDNTAKSLRIFELPNQQTLAPQNLAPLLTIDMWEHAYYVDYKNVKAQYLKNIWKIVNWKQVERRFNEAKSKSA